MPTFPRITVLAIVAASAVLLSGCLAPEPDPTPSPSPSATPVFASEEEALAAATETYAAYQAISDQITSEGGAAPDRMAPVLTPEYLRTELEGFTRFREAGSSTVGSASFDSIRLQQAPPELVSGARFITYLCVDVTAVRLLNSELVDITPTDRQNRLPLEIEFLISPDDMFRVLIDRSDVWTGENFC